ncbi:dihydroxyacetone kinase family protein [Ochrobactrum sp. Marseille-Q0166]|uniref:dihydroxyacetone kinase family protein n=1 Tax=Ochrobactrum sp. Marseille-Q0166 TaxID=2761105 RepID=UPI0016566278|nr:dihydroxyacetone kinase family protein [Ochrobactrum sp. Marseille-Q0166]MBC8719787.1 dihydroxyacetone kinase subunit DhaK [Ochrobactrum sp. Marseille-Q0166]
MKKIINRPADIVREMLEGLVGINADLSLLDSENVVIQSGLPAPEEREVALISGGGAGHEPAHAGYVGKGMLTAAVTGEIFTSPSADAVLAAIRASAGPAGALLIVKNYTGDRLNFGLAGELAALEGIPTELVVVADDVALAGIVPDERRRGIAGTVFVHKIAGAAAASGKSLAEVAAIARNAAERIGTMGVALGSCTVPAAGKPSFELGDHEIELGLGIHGEKGVERVNIMAADQLTDRLIDTIVDDRKIQAGARVAVLINGLGSTPPMELAIVARRALARLRSLNIEVIRAWSGNFLTAIEMPGCSITLFEIDDAAMSGLDYPTDASAWPRGGAVPENLSITHVSRISEGEANVKTSVCYDAKAVHAIALAVADALEQAEAELTDLDSKAGDGDLGASMVRGAQAIRDVPEELWADPANAFIALGNAVRRAIAGSSGPFYAIALTRAGRSLGLDSTSGVPDYKAAFRIATAAISEIGGAKAGDRTMLDALLPARDALDAADPSLSGKDVWHQAADAAEVGAKATAAMMPRLGRASYLGERAIGVPDGGAVAVAIWMRALANSL